ncbi:MAG: hypothetical protein ACLFWD_02790 [Anaerolineales bacterium]
MGSRQNIQSRALNCVSYESKRDVIELAERLVALPSVELAADRLVRTAEGKKHFVPFEGDPSQLVEELYYYEEIVPNEQLINIIGPEMAYFRILYMGNNERASHSPRYLFTIGLAVTMHTRDYSEAAATFAPIPGRDIPFDLVVHVLEEIANIFYDLFTPHYTWMSYSPPSYNRMAGESILDLKLHELHWLNIFGAPYVEKYGKEFLMSAPVHSTRALEDGGVELRLGRRLDQDDDEVSVEEIIEYFKPAGLKYLAWPKEIRVE